MMPRGIAIVLCAALICAAPGSAALAGGFVAGRVVSEAMPAGPALLTPTLNAQPPSPLVLTAPVVLTLGQLAPAPDPALAAVVAPAAATPSRPLLNVLTATAARLSAAFGGNSTPGAASAISEATFDGSVRTDDPLLALRAGERTFAVEPERSSLDEHTLADLEVLARKHGLHALLAARTSTAYGARRLENLLSRPFLDAGEIRRRQTAARELAADPVLRERVGAAFKALGTAANEQARAGFFDFKINTPIYVIGAVLSAGALSVIVTAVTAAVGTGSFRPILTLVQYLMPWLFIAVNLAGGLSVTRHELLRYKAVVRLAKDLAGPLANSASEALRELGGEFAAVSDRRRLGGLAGRLLHVMSSGAALVPDFLYLHSALTTWPAAMGVKRRRAELARLLGALSELDAYRALAETSHAYAGWSLYPEIAEDERPRLEITDGHHPHLAARGGSVGNDARLEPGANFHLLTGVNMGGKSTYLKMTGLLALLAQIGAPVPARAMTLTPLELLTSIEIKHDLAQGKSLYDAETDRILEVIRRAERGTRLFVLIDEILQGTNPQDRAAIERAIARYLARTGRLFLVATHNLDVVTLEGEETGVRNVHVEESPDGRATHKVLPGPSTTRNAVETLERKGFPMEIIRDSRPRP
jgi:hypothetical protein